MADPQFGFEQLHKAEEDEEQHAETERNPGSPRMNVRSGMLQGTAILLMGRRKRTGGPPLRSPNRSTTFVQGSTHFVQRSTKCGETAAHDRLQTTR